MTKRIVLLAVATLTVLSLFACQSAKTDKESSAKPKTASGSSSAKTKVKESASASSSAKKEDKPAGQTTSSSSAPADETKPNPPMSEDVSKSLQGTPEKTPAPPASDSGTRHSSGGIRHRLEVSQQVQRAWNTCAPTTVSMMLSYRGVNVSQEQLAQEMGTDESFGTHNANAIKILNKHLFGYETPTGNQAGYRLETVTDASPDGEQMRLFKERLVQNIKDGYPMYYTIDNAKIYPGKSGEHNLIGTGYVTEPDGTGVAYIYYIDPSYTAQDPTYGGLKIITPEELFNAMLPCVEPNYGW